MRTIADNNSTFRIEMVPFVDLISAEALVVEAERRFAVRDYDGLRAAGAVLASHNLPAAAGIGAYFVGLGVFNNGRGEIETARLHLEKALRFAPEHYQQRAALSLANLLWHEGEFSKHVRELELGLSLSDPIARIEFKRALAIAYSLDGNHRRALALLEEMWPSVAGSSAHLRRVRYEYLNSLAFEFEINGKHEDAKRVIAPVITSPYFNSNLEWQETAETINSRESHGALVSMFPKTTEQKHRGTAMGSLCSYLFAHTNDFNVTQIKALETVARAIVD